MEFLRAGADSTLIALLARTRVDLQHLAAQYCTPTSILLTDQHGAYTPFSALFDEHHTVNHSAEFMSREGLHTNLAENFFSRMRHAQGGAWHRMSVQYLEYYGWEFAWRQTMVGRSNVEQLQDLLKRLLASGRPTRFIDYWGKRPTGGREEQADPEDFGIAVEIDKRDVRKKIGRPKKQALRVFVADPAKPRGRARKSAVTATVARQSDATAAPGDRIQDPDPAAVRSNRPS